VDSAVGDFATGRLRSLWEMMNCTVAGICNLASQLMLEEISRNEDLERFSPEAAKQRIFVEDTARIDGWLVIAESFAKDFQCAPVTNRVIIIRSRMNRGISHRELSFELRVLRETISAGLKDQFIYRYPDEKARVFKEWKTDWADVIEKFPSAVRDVLSSVDLWAMGHPTASVFHSMRILEHGLRALASRVGRTFDIQNWQNIIDEIESEIRDRAKKLPRGSAKNEELKFLAEAAKEFTYFKDGWRNYVSHNRSDYDEYQARSVFEHVRTFMTVLSSQLSELPEAP
jgi:hypothetical protein